MNSMPENTTLGLSFEIRFNSSHYKDTLANQNDQMILEKIVHLHSTTWAIYKTIAQPRKKINDRITPEVFSRRSNKLPAHTTQEY